MSAVVESCRGSPLTHDLRASEPWSSSSGVTNHGPVGVNPGQHLPLLHWPPDSSSWKVRSERSLARTNPATQPRLSSGDPR